MLCSSDSSGILLERRAIFGKYTGLFALGTRGEDIKKDVLHFISTEIRNPSDLFLQIEPLSPLKLEGTKAPFRRFIEPVTALLNLKTSEETLLANFAEKGRYNIRLAQKREVSTRWVTASEVQKETNKTYIKAFFDLLDETTKRDGFAHNTLAYYKHFVETLESNNAGGLLVAEKDGILHAAGIFAYW